MCRMINVQFCYLCKHEYHAKLLYGLHQGLRFMCVDISMPYHLYKFQRYMYTLLVGMNEFLAPLYGIEWNTRQVSMRNVHWEPVNLQIWVWLEYFLLSGVMRWWEACTSLAFSDHNEFWCWMQEIVLPAQEILFCMSHDSSACLCQPSGKLFPPLLKIYQCLLEGNMNHLHSLFFLGDVLLFLFACSTWFDKEMVFWR